MQCRKRFNVSKRIPQHHSEFSIKQDVTGLQSTNLDSRSTTGSQHDE